jgi:hypothetical protein
MTAAQELRAMVMEPVAVSRTEAQFRATIPLAVDVAVAVAVRTLKEQKKLPERFKLTAKRVDDIWIVAFWPFPAIIGADFSVFVYDDGKAMVIPGW